MKKYMFWFLMGLLIIILSPVLLPIGLIVRLGRWAMDGESLW